MSLENKGCQADMAHLSHQKDIVEQYKNHLQFDACQNQLDSSIYN
jgi:hypothetical protein